MQPAAICVEHLSKTYPVPLLRLKKFLRRKFKAPVEALRNVSLEVREGEIFGLIGPNGAGKTTLVKVIATLVQPTAGCVRVLGEDTVANDQRVRSHVGLAAAEERSFYWRLSAEQNLLFFARLHGLHRRAATKRVKELLDLFHLDEFARRRFAELSTGNKQRLSVARAMIAAPPVLLLDEPTRSLDPIAAASMRGTIRKLAHENRATILLTSHNLGEIEELCSRVAIISSGEIQAIDTPRHLRTMYSETEQVTITCSGLTQEQAERAIAQNFPAVFFVVELLKDGESAVKFRRFTGDDTLDHVLRVLQQSGAIIRSVEAEKPTLLDVLQMYG